MRIKNNRTRLAVLLAATGAVFLSGCHQHGKYVEEGVSNAKKHMDSLKAATNWDMAQQRFEGGDLKKALDLIETSISYDPTVYKSHVLRGRVLMEMDRLEYSLASFERAMEVDPEGHEAPYYRGIVLERFTRHEQALEMYRLAATLDETNPQYRLAAIEMLISLDRVAEAEEALREGMLDFEHNAGFRQSLGHVAMLRGDTAEAMELFSQACLLAPADAALMEDLARAQIAEAQFADAEYTLSRLIRMEHEAERYDLKHLRAMCLLEIDRPVEARTILSELTSDDRGQTNVQAWVDLARAAMMLEDERRLRTCAQRVMALAPRRPDGYLLMAAYHRRAGNSDLAIAALERGVRVSDEIGDLAFTLGVLYHGAGRDADAMHAARLALSVDPTDARARELLDRVGVSSPRVADVPVED